MAVVFLTAAILCKCLTAEFEGNRIKSNSLRPAFAGRYGEAKEDCMDNQQWQQCIGALDAFYRALDNGDFESAYGYLSSRDKRIITLEQFLANRDEDYPPSSWDISPSRNVKRHIVRDNQNTEILEIAYLNVKLFGTLAPFEARMIKENSEWKVYHQSDIPRHRWVETSDDGTVETWRILSI